MGRLLILLGVLFGLWMGWRWLQRTPPEKLARHLTYLAISVAVVVLAILAATGRLPPLFAAIGAAVGAFFTLLLRLLRMPWVLGLAQRLLQFYRQKHSSNPTYGPGSRVETRFLRLFLDTQTGQMRGEIIAGRFAGYRLTELELGQLVALWRDYLSQDVESATLLEAYLDRVQGTTWRQQYGAGDQVGGGATPPTDGRMMPDEAYKILGLEPGATKEAVVEAHRRLTQRLHPDRGGSTYLAAKINKAKDVLLENLGKV